MYHLGHVQRYYFSIQFNSIQFNVEASTEEIWNQLKTALLDTTNETCGKTKKRHHRTETWWWNDEVNSAIAEKRRCWKAWKQGDGKEQNLQAKRNAKRTVYTAKKTAEEKKFSDLKPGMDDIFKIAKQLRKDNQDVVGDNVSKMTRVTSLLITRPRKLLGNNTMSGF